MTPVIIQCANTFCDNVVTKLGDVCEECKLADREAEEREKKTRWKWVGWNRRDNRRDAHGHKKAE